MPARSWSRAKRAAIRSSQLGAGVEMNNQMLIVATS